MAKIDDYKKAIEIAKKVLAGKSLIQIAWNSGCTLKMSSGGMGILSLRFLNNGVEIVWPELSLSFSVSGEEVPVEQQVLLLHYLNGASGSQLTGKWIGYQEIPDGKFYLEAFQRRAKVPMVRTFGERPDLLVELAATVFGAKPFDQGDFSVMVNAMPMISVALILWKGDDEFPPDGTMLFDRSICDILSAEDIAWLAGMIVYRLTGMAVDGKNQTRR